MGAIRSLRVFASIAALAIVLQGCDRESPVGAVILTASGAIEKSNRGPYNPKRDLFFKYHEVSFEKAFEFDRETLLLLGIHSVTVHPPEIDKPVTLQGPTLKSVLRLLGAENAQYIRFLGLDGFATELNAEDIASKDWIVAVDAGRKPLEIGGEGPVWVVFTPANPPKATEEEQARWPWAVFYMEIK